MVCPVYIFIHQMYASSHMLMTDYCYGAVINLPILNLPILTPHMHQLFTNLRVTALCSLHFANSAILPNLFWHSKLNSTADLLASILTILVTFAVCTWTVEHVMTFLRASRPVPSTTSAIFSALSVLITRKLAVDSKPYAATA